MREYPNIDAPVVSVRTYRGASSEVIESQVTTPLEDALSGIEGVETIKSVSREEVSQITLSFEPERDPDAAAADVRDRVARTRGVLPQEADESVISKVEAYKPCPAPEPAVLAERFRSPQSRREWAQRR